MSDGMPKVYYCNCPTGKEYRSIAQYNSKRNCCWCHKPLEEHEAKISLIIHIQGSGEKYVPIEGFIAELFQEYLENALFRPVEHFDDGVTTRNDVWGSEGPDCVHCPQEVGL